MYIAVTGGSGYIGSHTVVKLLQEGYEVVVIDNLCNSNPLVIDKIHHITGKRPEFIQGDILNTNLLENTFKKYAVNTVIHFAALKAVGESTQKPLKYFDNNVTGSLSLFKAMQHSDVQKIIFSSSACVYGKQAIPYTETTPRSPENPYGRTKYMVELILEDWVTAWPELTAISLRYFNPIGAHKSGLIGENPQGIPNNLMPYIAQVASGKREKLSVYGDHYDTADGTAKRDYIHVVDVAEGHVAALQQVKKSGFHTFNLGSGTSTSVLEMVHAFENATGVHIPYQIAPPRPGDLPEFYADASKAKRELHWQTSLSIEEACIDTWRWQQQLFS